MTDVSLDGKCPTDAPKEFEDDHKPEMTDNAEDFPFAQFAKEKFHADESPYSSRDVLKHPLLQLKERKHQRMALRIWVVLLRLMVWLQEPRYLALMEEHKATPVLWYIKDPPLSDIQMIQYIIMCGTTTPDLRDEIYCQLCKQLTKNSDNQSKLKVWELLCLCVGCFTPSGNLVNYLRNFIKGGPSDYASYCEDRLQTTIKKSSRLNSPGFLEIQATKSKKPLKLTVKFQDGTTIMVSVDSATTARDLCLHIAEQISLVDHFGFGLNVHYCNRAYRLVSGRCVMDMISICELEAVSRGENPDITSCYLVFYKAIFAPWQILSDDPVATSLIYFQVVDRVKSGQLGYDKDDDLVRMTAEQNVNDPKVKEDIVSYARNKLTTSFSLFWPVYTVAGPGLQKDTAWIAVNSTGLFVVDIKTDVSKWNGKCFIKLSFPKILSILSNRTDDMPWFKVIVTIQTVKGDQYTFTVNYLSAEEIKYIVEAIQTPPSKQDHSQAGSTDSDDFINAGMSRMKITASGRQDNKISGRPGKLSRDKMHGFHLEVMQNKHTFLLENLLVTPMIDYLYEKHVFDEDDLDQINTAKQNHGRRKSIERFLEILWHSGEHAYPIFLEVLEFDQVGFKQVADELKQCERQLQLARGPPTNWQKGQLLGTGAFGKVYKCCDKETGHEYAVKMVELGIPNAELSKEVEALQNEIMLLSRLQHDRIVQYYGSQNDGEVFSIFIEFMSGGSVKTFINDFGKLDESLVRKYSQQVLLGLAYLHKNRIVHRDIKADNILRDTKGNVKLADFGVSKCLQTVRNATGKGTVVGTPHWMAPEVINGEDYDGKADIWSVGCTVVEMLSSKPPFHKYDPFPAMFKIAQCKHPEYELPETVTRLAKDFLALTFQKIPADRWSAKKLIKHKFCQDET